jgi:hypothetical protein
MMTTTLSIDLLIISGLFIFGWFMLRSIWDGWGWLEVLAFSFPLGAGLITWCFFLVSWIGIPYTSETLIALYLILLALSVGMTLLRRRRAAGRTQADPNGNEDPNEDRSRSMLILGLVTILTIVAAIFALGRAYSTWDAIAIWGIKGYGIAQEATIFAGKEWGAHGLNYPLNLPLQISFFRLLEGDLWPGSKLLFPIYYAALLLGSYVFLSHRLEWKLATLGTLFLGTIPFVFEHATIGYANLPFTCYLVLGILQSVEGISNREAHRQVVGGILLGLAAWTRPEGVFLVIPVIVSLVLITRYTRHGKIHALAWLLPTVILILPWQVFTAVHGDQGLLSGSIVSMVRSWVGGNFQPESLYWILRFLGGQAIEWKIWGWITVVIVILFLVNIRRLSLRKYPLQASLLAATLAIGASVAVYYYLASYSQDLQYLLGTSVNRLFLPAWVLAVLWSIMLAGETGEFPSPAEEGMGV